MRGRLFFSSEKLPDSVVKFTFMDRSYLLEEFSMGFRQDIDDRGRPDGLPTGGIMKLVFAQTPDKTVNEWATSEILLRDGEIRFLSGDIKVTAGADLIISFEDACCIEYRKRIRTLKGGLFTTLVLSPRKVSIRNEVFVNNWKQDEELPYYIRSAKTD
jgi:hypothetical protein